MKTKRIGMRFKWFGVLAIATAAIVGLAISPAIGASGLLTQKKGVKLFFTKKQANKLFLTKKAGTQLVTNATAETDKRIAAATAGLVSKAQADSSYLPANGSVQLQISPGNWQSRGGVASIDLSTNSADLDASAASADEFFGVNLTIPSVLAGRPVSITSFELCYNAAGATATIDRVFLFTSTPAGTNVSPSGTTPINDETDRDDTTCRTYAGAAPVPIGPTTLSEIVLRNDYSAAGGITVTRLTVNLST